MAKNETGWHGAPVASLGCLGYAEALAPHADLGQITTAYLRLSRDLASGISPLGAEEAEFRLKLVKRAYEVLSSPSRRSDYVAGLTVGGAAPSLADQTMHIEVALEASFLVKNDFVIFRTAH